MSTSSQSVLTAFEQGVLTITLDRPKANAFNTEMSQAAQAAFKTAQCDETVRCVLLTGSGSFFSAGQDITEVKDEQDFSFRRHLQRTYHPLVLQICILTFKLSPPGGKINLENEPTWTLESPANEDRRQGDEKGGRLRTDTESISY